MRTQQTNTRDRWHRRSEQDARLVPVPHLIGVGVDGAPAGRDAVVLAAMLARATQAELMLLAVFEEPLLEGVVPADGSITLASGAELHVRVVVVDRVAGGTRTQDTLLGGETVVTRQLASLSGRARAAALATGARAHLDVIPGAPAARLRELCDHVDLLVIGSGHASASGRVQLGRAGRTLLRDAPAPILIAPRPRHAAAV